MIPKSEWKDITHIFITHGKNLILGPRNKGVAFTTPMKKLHTISVDETIQLDGMSVTGIRATHGSLTLKLGPFSKTLHPGPEERVGWGAIGFNIQLDDKNIINLGDTLLHEKEWSNLKNPDVLMIPIGGRTIQSTMDEEEALQAIYIMKPKLVMPCHFSAQYEALKAVNKELVGLYWDIGQMITERQADAKHGSCPQTNRSGNL